MKKFFIAGIIVIIAIVVTIFAFNNNSKSTYVEISYDDFISKTENKESFILFVGSEYCSHCQSYKSTVNRIVRKYGVTINYIDISKFSDEQTNKFKTYINFDATPTTVFIYDGEEKTTYNRINGNLSIETVIKRLKKEGYIKE